MRRVCDVHEKMDATPLDFQPEHILIILGELDAVRLLKVSLSRSGVMSWRRFFGRDLQSPWSGGRE